MTLLPPTPEQAKRMREELDQDPAVTRRDVQALREWLLKQPHLPSHMDDERLERFLYGCKFSLERTKQVLDTYYRARATTPEFFANRDPKSEGLQRNFRELSYFVLPKLTEEGYRVTIFRLNSLEVESFNLQELTKRVVMVLDVRLKEENCLSNIMIVDCQGFTLHHFARLSPTLAIVRKAMLCVQDAFPLRLHQVHFANCMPFVDKVAAAFTPLLKEKLVRKFFFHSGLDRLHRHVDASILPVEYGGKAGTFQELNDGSRGNESQLVSQNRHVLKTDTFVEADAWKCKLESYQKWFLEEEKISKSDESKRLKKLPPSSVLIEDGSVEGSFRKLLID